MLGPCALAQTQDPRRHCTPTHLCALTLIEKNVRRTRQDAACLHGADVAAGRGRGGGRGETRGAGWEGSRINTRSTL